MKKISLEAIVDKSKTFLGFQPPKERDYNETPLIEHEGNYSIIRNAVVGVYCSSYCALPFAHVVKLSSSFDADIQFRKKDKWGKRDIACADGKSIMGLLALELYPGTLADIYVSSNTLIDGDSIALGLYAGITTLGEKPEFNWPRRKEK